MKILRFILGTIVSIVALAIAAKIAAILIAILGSVVALTFFLLKLALIVGIGAFVVWVVLRLFAPNRRSESI